MKGVSAVISVILILMIVVALAAMAFTWMTQMQGGLQETTSEAVENVESNVQQVSIQGKSCTGGALNFILRNTGVGDIDISTIGAFLNEALVTDLTPNTGTIAENALAEFDANTPVCQSGDTLRVTLEAGQEARATLD
jgi:flagellin-like protein